ncbi:hypothetical protein EDB92DRAFT_1871460 [Lactarius akahatsu]|uniref:Secreted protein n=1 Tax=Lactarius akahatsu TaxID=416441 RepID=A0AAD4LII0_9AGAM|nr:hypothetical protein EDB92DRAFT_1871460 [Lactarius akahatsu]
MCRRALVRALAKGLWRAGLCFAVPPTSSSSDASISGTPLNVHSDDSSDIEDVERGRGRRYRSSGTETRKKRFSFADKARRNHGRKRQLGEACVRSQSQLTLNIAFGPHVF